MKLIFLVVCSTGWSGWTPTGAGKKCCHNLQAVHGNAISQLFLGFDWLLNMFLNMSISDVHMLAYLLILFYLIHIA